jgi:hypothetical protein
MCKIDTEEFNVSKYRRLARRASEVLSGNSKLKPSLLNSVYFMSMKKIIKDNQEYFPFETKVWMANNWFSQNYKQALRAGRG